MVQSLVLYIFKEGDHLNTDRNGYISTCHHPGWVRPIPKGLFMSIKCNCDEDFLIQMDMLVQRFREKGYQKADLERTRDLVGGMNREELLQNKEKHKQQFDIAFITGYNLQYREVGIIHYKNCFLKKKKNHFQTGPRPQQYDNSKCIGPP